MRAKGDRQKKKKKKLELAHSKARMLGKICPSQTVFYGNHLLSPQLVILFQVHFK